MWGYMARELGLGSGARTLYKALTVSKNFDTFSFEINLSDIHI
jgi:hypothetical protein